MDLKTLFQQALAAHKAGNLAQAENAYTHLLKEKPGHAQVSYLLGALRAQQGRSAEAVTLLEVALAAQPRNPAILLHLGNALQDQKRFDAALERYDQALALKPDYGDALNNRGNALTAMERFDEAFVSFNAALAIQPDDAPTWYNLGLALHKARRPLHAIAAFERALAIRPDFAEGWNNKGAAFLALKNPGEALACFDRALTLQPYNSGMLMNRGSALQGLKRPAEAITVYDHVLALEPDHALAWGEAAKAVLAASDWPRMEKIAAEMPDKIASGSTVDPWVALSYTGDPALHLACARNSIREAVPQPRAPLWRSQKYDHTRIRLAYVSPDFRDHPVGYQVADLLEQHDRARFEVIAISTGARDQGDISRRIEAACDQFHEADNRSLHETAQLIRRLEVDVVVDLGGFTDGSGLMALAHRPAPVQLSWLGYPGTTGADFIDAVIADRIALPQEQQGFYAEKIVHLPDSFFPMDSKRRIDAQLTRAEAGLPPEGFIFCGFSNNWKITPSLLDRWMRILKAVPGSVLWLRTGTEEMLRREAAARGVEPERLIFALFAPLEVHHARHRLADLFLDALPYNAHTTAADALWGGLPVLTQIGDTFAGRVGASLVTAAGLPELVTHSGDEYESLAVSLARDPARLMALRRKLVENRATAPLFDTARFARNLESAFETMLHEKSLRIADTIM